MAATFQMVEVAVPRALFQQVLGAIAALRIAVGPMLSAAGLGRAGCRQESCSRRA